MSRLAIKVDYATQADIESFYGKSLPYTIRAIALKIDGIIVGMGGVYAANVPTAVMDFKGTIPKKSVWRATKAGMLNLFDRYPAVYTQRDITIASSARYLARMGFIPLDEHNEVYIWLRPSRSS